MPKDFLQGASLTPTFEALMVKFGGKIGTLYQMLKNALKKQPLQNRTNVQIKGGGSKAFWTMFKKTALFWKEGIPNLALPNDKWKQGCAWKSLGQFSDQGGELGNTAYSLVLWDIRGNTQLKTLAKHRPGLSLIEDVHYVCLIIHDNGSYLLNRVFHNYRGNRIYLWFIRSLVVCG